MERWGKNTIYYYYDKDGITGFRLNDTDYYYHKNIFGDVLAIYDMSGLLAATYEYDAWGNHKIYNQNGAEINKSTIHIGNINPIRYRGYYWDSDFNLYYLQSRYYSPELGRFISPDSVEYLAPDTIGGLNLYAYCMNNPISYCDPSGHFAIGTFLIGLAVTSLVGWGLSEIFGAQTVGGASSIVNGATAISTGVSLFAFGPVGWVIGGIGIVAGVASIAFGTAEIQEGLGYGNWINDIGISGDLYTGLYIGSNIISSLATIGGTYYKTTAHGQRAFALQNVKKFGYTDTVSQHMMDSGYFGKKYGSTGITTKSAPEIRPYTNSLWAQKTVIKYGVMTIDDFGWVFTYDGYRLGINNAKRLIWHFGQGF